MACACAIPWQSCDSGLMDWDLPLGSVSSGDSFQHLLAQAEWASSPSSTPAQQQLPHGALPDATPAETHASSYQGRSGVSGTGGDSQPGSLPDDSAAQGDQSQGEGGAAGSRPRGRGRGRKKAGGVETAQQRAHRRFYLKKKARMQDLEDTLAERQAEVAGLESNNAALRLRLEALDRTLAGREDHLHLLQALEALQLDTGSRAAAAAGGVGGSSSSSRREGGGPGGQASVAQPTGAELSRPLAAPAAATAAQVELPAPVHLTQQQQEEEGQQQQQPYLTFRPPVRPSEVSPFDLAGSSTTSSTPVSVTASRQSSLSQGGAAGTSAAAAAGGGGGASQDPWQRQQGQQMQSPFAVQERLLLPPAATPFSAPASAAAAAAAAAGGADEVFHGQGQLHSQPLAITRSVSCGARVMTAGDTGVTPGAPGGTALSPPGRPLMRPPWGEQGSSSGGGSSWAGPVIGPWPAAAAAGGGSGLGDPQVRLAEGMGRAGSQPLPSSSALSLRHPGGLTGDQTGGVGVAVTRSTSLGHTVTTEGPRPVPEAAAAAGGGPVAPARPGALFPDQPGGSTAAGQYREPTAPWALQPKQEQPWTPRGPSSDSRSPPQHTSPFQALPAASLPQLQVNTRPKQQELHQQHQQQQRPGPGWFKMPMTPSAVDQVLQQQQQQQQQPYQQQQQQQQFLHQQQQQQQGRHGPSRFRPPGPTDPPLARSSWPAAAAGQGQEPRRQPLGGPGGEGGSSSWGGRLPPSHPFAAFQQQQGQGGSPGHPSSLPNTPVYATAAAGGGGGGGWVSAVDPAPPPWGQPPVPGPAHQQQQQPPQAPEWLQQQQQQGVPGTLAAAAAGGGDGRDAQRRLSAPEYLMPPAASQHAQQQQQEVPLPPWLQQMQQRYPQQQQQQPQQEAAPVLPPWLQQGPPQQRQPPAPHWGRSNQGDPAVAPFADPAVQQQLLSGPRGWLGTGGPDSRGPHQGPGSSSSSSRRGPLPGHVLQIQRSMSDAAVIPGNRMGMAGGAPASGSGWPHLQQQGHPAGMPPQQQQLWQQQQAALEQEEELDAPQLKLLRTGAGMTPGQQRSWGRSVSMDDRLTGAGRPLPQPLLPPPQQQQGWPQQQQQQAYQQQQQQGWPHPRGGPAPSLPHQKHPGGSSSGGGGSPPTRVPSWRVDTAPPLPRPPSPGAPHQEAEASAQQQQQQQAYQQQQQWWEVSAAASLPQQQVQWPPQPLHQPAHPQQQEGAMDWQHTQQAQHPLLLHPQQQQQQQVAPWLPRVDPSWQQVAAQVTTCLAPTDPAAAASLAVELTAMGSDDLLEPLPSPTGAYEVAALAADPAPLTALLTAAPSLRGWPQAAGVGPAVAGGGGGAPGAGGDGVTGGSPGVDLLEASRQLEAAHRAAAQAQVSLVASPSDGDAECAGYRNIAAAAAALVAAPSPAPILQAAAAAGELVYLHQVVPWYREQLRRMSELLSGVSGDERVTAQLMGVVDDTVFRLRKFAALNRLGMWQLKGMNLATGRLESAPADTWAGVVGRVAPDAAQVAQVLAVAEVAAAQDAAVVEQRAATLAELDVLVSQAEWRPAGPHLATTSTAPPGASSSSSQVQGRGGGAGSTAGPTTSSATPPAGAEPISAELGAAHSRAVARSSSAAAAAAQPAPPAVAWTGQTLQFSPPGLFDYQPVLAALHASMHREHVLVNMLMYGLFHVLHREQMARALVASWPFWPDVPAMVEVLRQRQQGAGQQRRPLAWQQQPVPPLAQPQQQQQQLGQQQQVSQKRSRYDS